MSDKRQEKGAGGRRRAVLIAVAAVLLLAGIYGGYVYFTDSDARRKALELAGMKDPNVEYKMISVYYPYGGKLNLEERGVPETVSMVASASAAVNEYLDGPAGEVESYVPKGASLLGVYYGLDGVLYVDLSDEFKSNFSGDALSEFLLMRGLYETVRANAYEVKGVKVLVEGREVESMGGHIAADTPMRDMPSHPLVEGGRGK